MGRLCSLLFVLLLIITGCSKDVKINTNTMPQSLPADFDFMVSFGYGEVTKNEINTYQDTVVKDLVINGTATANMTFTVDEMRIIYEKMREINIMGTKDLVPTNQNCGKKPFSKDRWKISVNGVTKELTWSEEYCDVTSDAQELLELRTFIQDIVADKDAYKELPQAEGGYD
ncbi:hypothetical protein PBAT_11695 [Paenibacillus antarcticus]|uniref:Uncharacterized protein n=2 Tax=Paenibacillus antarcticus TaxID=253703 RepID=A0A162KF14_9BACL|nr:hypothetical protein [Paenibacillus antarcticus]OAB45578.1 hypothetical protein PBAT_11695 [Paenibacillus antarcticus]